MHWKLVLIVQAYLHLHCANGANILALMGVASPSHSIWNGVLLHELGNRGHNVTILSTDLPKSTKDLPPSVHYIHLEQTYASVYSIEDMQNSVGMDDYIGKGGISALPEYYEYSLKACKGILRSKGFQVVLDYPDDHPFDLVIHDYSTGPCLLGFMHKFGYPPLVGISAFHNPPHTADLIGSHQYPAFIPHHNTIYSADMSFLQRVHNTAILLADNFYRRTFSTPAMDKLVRPYFPGMPALTQIEQMTQIALVNTHPAVSFPEPLPPNVIEVGGMQLTDPNPLPKELDEFIQKSKNGAILFSLGTNMRREDLGPVRIQIIVDTMAQLPEYNFLWKLDLGDMELKTPANVLIKPFFPQRDILDNAVIQTHENLKLFVTHAGGLSTHEATWYGVPMVGIALFADQMRNLAMSVLQGVAVRVDYKTLSVESLKSAILQVAKDASFKERMALPSSRFRDRPMHPLKLAVWWVEYLLRDPEAGHLQSPTLRHALPGTGYSLDILLAVITAIVLMKVACGCVCKWRCSSVKKVRLNKKKNQ